MEIDEITYEQIKKKLLESLNEQNILFPSSFKTDQVYKIQFNRIGIKGKRDLAFKIIPIGFGVFNIDYFLETEDYSIHMRIDQNGMQQKLENYEGQFGWPILESENRTKEEHERMRKHNDMVREVLRRKGFSK